MQDLRVLELARREQAPWGEKLPGVTRRLGGGGLCGYPEGLYGTPKS